MSQPQVYVALQQFGEHDERPRRLLEEAGFAVRYNTLGRRLRVEELAEQLRDTDAVLAGVELYDAVLLGSLPRLRCISRCGTGTDAIDLDAARRQGITIYTTLDEVIEPVAQLTVTMMLALARNLPLHLRDFGQGEWIKRSGFLLSEWTIGLIGFGRIGRAVERLLRPFAPTILVADPEVRVGETPVGVELRELTALLAEADCISLHANRPKAQGTLLGRPEFARMKPGSVLINTARGYLVDEAALYDVLTSGRLAGAALDVFETEPYHGPLAALPNVLCTPHVATLTRASRIAMELRCATYVVNHFTQSGALESAAAGRLAQRKEQP